MRPTLILHERSAIKGSSSVNIAPNCLFEKLSDYVDNTTIYTINSPSTEAINWLTKDDSGYSECEDSTFLERYALSVLNFAAPINGSDREDGLWIQPESQCFWSYIVCSGDYKSIRLDFLTLDLSSTGISGTIATEIGLLTNLRSYDAGMFLFLPRYENIYGIFLSNLLLIICLHISFF